MQASITNQFKSPFPCPLAPLIKTPIRAKHLSFSLFGVYSSSQQTELLRTHTFCKDDLLAYSLCILIIFEMEPRMAVDAHSRVDHTRGVA
ncbi:MAG: hypothetical protein ACK56F_03675 [bacterium]